MLPRRVRLDAVHLHAHYLSYIVVRSNEGQISRFYAYNALPTHSLIPFRLRTFLACALGLTQASVLVRRSRRPVEDSWPARYRLEMGLGGLGIGRGEGLFVLLVVPHTRV